MNTSKVLFYLLLAGIFVSACPSFNIIDIQSTQNVRVGDTAHFYVTVENALDTPQTILVKVPDCEPDYLSCIFTTDTRVQLAPYEVRKFDLDVETLNAIAGEYSISLFVSNEALGGGCSETYPLTLDVQPALPTPTPTPQLRYTLSPNYKIFLRDGDKIDYTLTLINDYNTTLFARVEQDETTNPFFSSTKFDYTEVRVPAYSKKEIHFSITIPPGTPASNYSILLKLKAGAECCLEEFPLELNICIFGYESGVSFYHTPSGCSQVKQGGSVGEEFAILNRGEVENTFQIRLVDFDHTGALSLSKEYLDLKPGERGFFNVSINAPQSLRSGRYYYMVQVYFDGYLGLQQDFCFEVSPTCDVEISIPNEKSFSQCSSFGIPVTFTNVGTSTDNYSIETSPIEHVDVAVQPDYFSLDPLESRNVSFVFSSNINSPVGEYVAPFVVRSSCGVVKQENILFKLVSGVAASDLKIEAQNMQVPAGYSTDVKIPVTSLISKKLYNVSLIIGGVNSSWYSVSAPASISPGQKHVFTVTFTPPKGSVGNYPISLIAFSGEHSGSLSLNLKITYATKSIGFQIIGKHEIKEGGVLKALLLSARVSNTGNVPISNIYPFFDSLPNGWELVNATSIYQLAPGKSADILITLRPLKTGMPEQLAGLDFASEEGAKARNFVPLPGVKAQGGWSKFVGSPADLIPRIFIVLGLLVVLFAVLIYEK